jgi:hypothetical protein
MSPYADPSELLDLGAFKCMLQVCSITQTNTAVMCTDHAELLVTAHTHVHCFTQVLFTVCSANAVCYNHSYRIGQQAL